MQTSWQVYLPSVKNPSNFSVKKECDKLLLAQKSSGSNQNNSQSVCGQLRHITEESLQEDVPEDSDDVSNEDFHNDTNDAVLNYFSCVTKHYLQLVKSTPDLITRHSMAFPIIADSGANFHMFHDRTFFTSLTPTTGKVILGDGKTMLNIHGIGTIPMKIDDHILTIDNVRCVPDLSESIYSLFLHVRTPHHGLQSSFEHGSYILFPEFQTKAVLVSDDIYLDAVPVNYNSQSIPSMSGSGVLSDVTTCKHLTQPSFPITIDSKKEDNLLRDLHQYYSA
jgi:hypothetical protein